MMSDFVFKGIRKNKTRFNRMDIAKVNSRIFFVFAMNAKYVINNFLNDSIFVSGGD